ncbi:MAG: iron chelate uptake ABC transporter family permease subunit [Dehalococcoidia bacterium]|nr:iron chelate uptake ABC transporter family permease subunit [Dehalococcoidia bacterium]
MTEGALPRPAARGSLLAGRARWGFRLRLGGSLGLALACVIFALTQGAAGIDFVTVVQILLSAVGAPLAHDWSAAEQTIILDVRLPRVLMAAAVGATLALCGGAYQAVLRNPLADPYLIGAAAGASLGGTIAIISPIDVAFYPFSVLSLFAFTGALVATFASYLLARTGSGSQVTTLILAGVTVSAFATALTSLLMLRSEDDVRAILAWVLGGFNLASWSKMWLLIPYVLPAGALIILHGRVLNAMQLDEHEAQQLGVDVTRVRLTMIIAASVGTAAAVSVSGVIGFIGLVIPHTVRLLCGPDNRQLLPVAAALGAAMLVLADLAARTLIEPAEVPVGIVTAIIGAPFFLILLRRRRPLSFR